MSATATPATAYPTPNREQLLEGAEQCARALVDMLDKSDADITPYLLIATPLLPAGVHPVLLPPITDPASKARIFCRFVPAVLLAFEATGCALVMASWTAPSTSVRPSKHPQREEIVFIAASDPLGDTISSARVIRRKRKAPCLAAWRRTTGSVGFGLLVSPVHAIFGRYDADSLAPSPQLDYLFEVRCAKDVREAVFAAYDKSGDAAVDFGFQSHVHDDGQGALTVCRTEEQAEVVRGLYAEAGAEVLEASASDKMAYLAFAATSAPLLEHGYTMEQINGLGILTEDECWILDRVCEPVVPQWMRDAAKDERKSML